MTEARVLRFPGRSSTACAIGALALLAGCGGSDVSDGVVAAVEVADAGLVAPWAIVHDPVDDVYLVANVSGDPLAEDENGFISRVSPDGEVLSQQWFPRLGSGDRIHAPKGIGILGDSVFVADLDCIHVVHRASGDLLESRCLDVGSLAGLAVGPEGSVFVVDIGYELSDGQRTETLTDAVYRLSFQEGRLENTVASGPDLGHPTGVAVGSLGIFVTTEGGALLRFTPAGDETRLLEITGQALEGVTFLSDGGFAYSVGGDGSVFAVEGGGGAVSAVAESIGRPGNIGYDAVRNRVLVPLPDADRLLFFDL